MKKVAGIRFKTAGKVYDFDCGAFVLNRGDHVIVETEKGLGFGIVVNLPVPLNKSKSNKPLKKMFRLASKEDIIQREKNIELQKTAHTYCLKCIKELGLNMNLFNVESTFDANRLTFFFTADGRVDFRQLVKTLVKEFRIRIEMRQVGIRNQTKMCGGIGRCGREICCSAFIEKFEPVSIRMAKEQGLSLNPTKISGLCGRLMCCLTYESETYKKLKENLPKIGTMLKTSSGEGKVIRHNVMCNRLTIRTTDGTELETKLTNISTKKD